MNTTRKIGGQATILATLELLWSVHTEGIRDRSSARALTQLGLWWCGSVILAMVRRQASFPLPAGASYTLAVIAPVTLQLMVSTPPSDPHGLRAQRKHWQVFAQTARLLCKLLETSCSQLPELIVWQAYIRSACNKVAAGHDCWQVGAAPSSSTRDALYKATGCQSSGSSVKV